MFIAIFISIQPRSIERLHNDIHSYKKQQSVTDSHSQQPINTKTSI